MAERNATFNPEFDPPRMPGFNQADAPAPPEELLNDDLFPEDAYQNGVYWADLPFGERVSWVNRQSNAEALREIKLLAHEFYMDPLQPFRDYFDKYVITGMGLFIEGYTLFSVGNVTSLFQAVWPACWKTYEVCNANWIASVSYLEIVGIILGQVTVGFIGDWIGRRWGMIQDVVIMLLGTVLLTGMWGTTFNGWIICYALSLLFYSIGVGGEYPMTSTRAMEGGTTNTSTGDKLHRGRNVALAFTMQGWGQLINQAVLIIFLLIFHGGGNPPYGEVSTQWTFRLSFAFIGIFTLWLLYYRVYKMKFADRALRISKRKSSVTGYDSRSLNLVMTHYWHRLVGTAGGWFCNDFFFYGNKIFQGVFIKIIDPGSTVMGGWLWNLVNVGVSLAGYYVAAFTIDHKFYGRVRMQAIGFAADFILFIIPAALFNQLQQPGGPIKVFQFMYFFSSFWNQFGPNATTFLLAAEVYPAPIRSTAHGVSAACGKLGALVPAIVYNYVSNQTKFWIVPWFGLAGFLITFIFVPDTTGLDLREQERYWLLVREGRPQDYHGIAIHPRHLSMYERYVLHRHRYYDPELDRQAKIEELRARYEKVVMKEKAAQEDPDFIESESMMSEKTYKYFQLEKQRNSSSDDTTRENEKVADESDGNGSHDKVN
jgi:Sugar (and other) transporter